MKDTDAFIREGQVVDVADPDQMGRVRVWVQSWDGENIDTPNIPWADYASPFFGFTVDYPAGEANIDNHSSAAYGMWAIPKVGATVYVFCKNGSASTRCYFAGSLRLHRNRSLPAGRNSDFNGKQGPWGDTGDGTGNLNPIQPAYDNLRTQFQNKVSQSEAMTRGAYERNVAQASNNKDGSEGYSANPSDATYLDPQTYCIVTPGRNAIIMQDDPHYSRLRLKTAEGHQIIFDDANERIYVSTSKGNTWVELDQDGHINIFGASSISMSSGKDINLFAAGSINMEAAGAGGINLTATKGDARVTTAQSFQVSATQNIVESACGFFDMNSEQGVHVTAAQDMNLRSNQSLNMTGDAGISVMSGAMLTASASTGVSISGTTLILSGTTSVDMGSAGPVTLSGSPLNLNGPPIAAPNVATIAAEASCADQAIAPAIVPTFEPWTRPVSDVQRGPNWKP
jgi:hypothetical protein